MACDFVDTKGTRILSPKCNYQRKTVCCIFVRKWKHNVSHSCIREDCAKFTQQLTILFIRLIRNTILPELIIDIATALYFSKTRWFVAWLQIYLYLLYNIIIGSVWPLFSTYNIQPTLVEFDWSLHLVWPISESMEWRETFFSLSFSLSEKEYKTIDFKLW